MPKFKATLNCDMGEGYAGGMYAVGELRDDEGIMPLIDVANVACGFHAGDYTVMAETVKLAKKNKVKVGSHPSLPDRQGFGRREMKLSPEEVRDMMIFQTGSLLGFLKAEDLELSHIKPHGALYGMASKDEGIAKAAVGVAKTFGVPFMGLPGTLHESTAKELGVPFIAEWFADLNYTSEGQLIITKKHDPIPDSEISSRVKRVLSEGLVTTVSGTQPLGQVEALSICVHSDTPGCVETAKTIRKLVDESNAT